MTRVQSQRQTTESVSGDSVRRNLWPSESEAENAPGGHADMADGHCADVTREMHLGFTALMSVGPTRVSFDSWGADPSSRNPLPLSVYWAKVMQLATIAQWKAKVERVATSMGMPEIVACEDFRALEGDSGP